MTQKQTTRREFLKTSAATATAGAVIPYFAWSPKAFANVAANDRPRIGCIGVGSMGTGDARGHADVDVGSALGHPLPSPCQTERLGERRVTANTASLNKHNGTLMVPAHTKAAKEIA